MGKLHLYNQHFFKEWGRRGGLKRAQGLSRALRTQIAVKAVQARWKKHKVSRQALFSIRLRAPDLNHPSFLEELLLDGSLEQWVPLYKEISNYPFGTIASTLEKVLASTEMYGVTPLWRGILKNARGFS